MKVKTRAELLSLDDELNLFDEEDWQFIGGVVDTKAENYQFYNDIRDTDFDIRVNNMETFKNIVTVGIIFIILLSGIGILKYGFIDKNEKEEYNKLVALQDFTVEDGLKIQYKEGNACDMDVVYAVSTTINAYFNVLRTKSDYDILDTYCVDKSTLNNQYMKYTDKMNFNYDIYDCYARALKEMGSYCTVNRIDRVIEKDGKYYCYVLLNVPTTIDVQNYVNTYKVNMTKYFTVNEQNDSNFYRFLLKTMEDYAMPTTANLYCFELEKIDEDYYICDDEQITNLCVTDYTSAIAYMSILVEKI